MKLSVYPAAQRGAPNPAHSRSVGVPSIFSSPRLAYSKAGATPVPQLVVVLG